MESEQCIQCGRCTAACGFLDKYQLDFSNEYLLKPLAYHCFLCGECSRVCPVGIDGRSILLHLREERVQQRDGRLDEPGYGLLTAEKEHYLFRNYRHVNAGSVLFTGCNFPSFYPQTVRRAYELISEKQKIGLVYDCCGKPIAELGKEKEAQRIVREIESRLLDDGVTEVITMCPNCYYFLKPRLKIKTVSIYEKLSELGIGNKISIEDINIFLPCPDREEQLWLRQMKPYLPEHYSVIQEIQCCGMGGCAVIREPQLAADMRGRFKKYDNVYTYCATCGGNITAGGHTGVHHILAEITGTGEKADTRHSLFNRAKAKFK